MTKRVFEFTVLDPPTPMGRKRFSGKSAGGKHFYSEGKDIRSVYHIRQTFVTHYPELNPTLVDPVSDAQSETPVAGAVKLSVRCWFKAPATMSRKKRIAAWMNPVSMETKPDLNNVINQVCDALSGYAYVDDKLIAGITDCWRFYAVDREGNDTPPRMVIRVEEL